jgi:hypothetical protein
LFTPPNTQALKTIQTEKFSLQAPESICYVPKYIYSEEPLLEDEQAATMEDAQAAAQEVRHHFDLNIPVS